MASENTHPVALTIGNFDGVHAGHRALVERCRERIGPGGKVIALAFHPHPMVTLASDHAPTLIEPFRLRAQRLLDAGVDKVVELTPTPELLGQSPQSFVDHLIDEYQPRVIVEGHDFHFGKRRTGTPVVLKELAAVQGVEVDILPPVQVALTDQSIVTASSTITRWLLVHGRVRDAAFVLGRPHELVGTVVRGDQLGRRIGFPTANVRTDSMLPADGVYAATVALPDGSIVAGAVNVGSRPTVEGRDRRAEVHIMDADGNAWEPGDGLAEYDWDITVRLIGWVRDQIRFPSVDALSEQLSRDVRRAARMVRPLLETDPAASSV
ncbi:MAG: riboflavin biosynthesis protein RibF [Phycisphaerales bacterium]